LRLILLTATGGRRAYERKQGDEEEGETERERELEAGLIKDAAERKAKEAKTMRHHSS